MLEKEKEKNKFPYNLWYYWDTLCVSPSGGILLGYFSFFGKAWVAEIEIYTEKYACFK
jgi:hypothetical protein